MAGYLEGRLEQSRGQTGTKTERLDLDRLAVPKHRRHVRTEHPFGLRQALDHSQVRALEGREFQRVQFVGLQVVIADGVQHRIANAGEPNPLRSEMDAQRDVRVQPHRIGVPDEGNRRLALASRRGTVQRADALAARTAPAHGCPSLVCPLSVHEVSASALCRPPPQAVASHRVTSPLVPKWCASVQIGVF